jgi:hypothetical protein
VIRHVGGSKIHRVEQFPLDVYSEITLGRSRAATIQFDPVADDAVSRNHAVITVVDGDSPSFALSDLNSSNGTFLNGKRVTGAVELLPTDQIELGQDGPKFVFDVQPRPENLAARTRIIVASKRTLTDPPPAAKPAAPAEPPTPEAAIAASIARPSPVVGPPFERWSASGRGARYAVIAGIVLLGAMAAIYGYSRSTGPKPPTLNQRATTQLAPAERITSPPPVAAAIGNAKPVGSASSTSAPIGTRPRLATDTVKPPAETTGSSPPPPVAPPGPEPQQIATAPAIDEPQIAEHYRKAVVRVQAVWWLYDKTSNKPLVHKLVSCRAQRLPAYVKLRDGSVVPWLTTSNDGNRNREIGDKSWGTGLVVGAEGLIVTDRQAVHPPTAGRPLGTEFGKAVIAPLMSAIPKDPKQRQAADQLICDSVGPEPRLPEPRSQGFVFDGQYPVTFDPEPRVFEASFGRYQIQQPGGAMPRAATLDALGSELATLKILPDAPLNSMQPQGDTAINRGDKVFVLGYSAPPRAAFQPLKTGRADDAVQLGDDNLQPIAMPAVISDPTDLSPPDRGMAGTTAYRLDNLQLGASAAGGPIFDMEGRLVGLLVFRKILGFEQVPLAIPIDDLRQLILRAAAGAPQFVVPQPVTSGR